MLRKIALGLLLLGGGFSLVVAMQPAEFHYERSMAINAAPEKIFPYINDVQLFQKWNPFAAEDPESRISFTGPDAGVGAAAHWSGGTTGEGSMTVAESIPPKVVRYRMEFRKPLAATHTAEFQLEPKDGKTVVSWSLYGENPFLGKAIGLLIDCDKMCGEQFIKGLSMLKAVVEEQKQAAASP